MHPTNEITFLDKTTKTGVCSECVNQLTQQHHELMPIQSTVKEVKDLLVTLEVNMLELLRERTALC